MEKIINIGITINFDRNFLSNGLQQNVVFLNHLLNKIKNFRCFYIYEGSQINDKIVDKKFCWPYKNITHDNCIDFDHVLCLLVFLKFIRCSIFNDDCSVSICHRRTAKRARKRKKWISKSWKRKRSSAKRRKRSPPRRSFRFSPSFEKLSMFHVWLVTEVKRPWRVGKNPGETWTSSSTAM